MAEVAFDTIAEVRRLQDVGFRQEQAEAITRSIHAGVTGGVATKADLAMVEAGLRGDMERLGGELRTEIANVRTEIAGVHGELKQEIAGLRAELKQEIANVRTEIAGVHGELKQEIAGLRTELKGDIAGLRTEIDSVRSDLLWIKLIGGAVLAAVVLPWLAEAAGTMFGN